MQHPERYFLLSLIIAVLSWNSARAGVYSDSTLNATLLGPRTETVNMKDYTEIVYVSSETGSDKNGDGSRQKPFMTIGKALAQIRDAGPEKRYALFVAKGIYNQQTIGMKGYVDLYGGFAPETWERDIYTYATVLDGRQARRVVTGEDNARIDGFTITHGLSRSHGGGILCDGTSPLISNNFISENFVLEPEDFNPTRIHQEGNIGGGIACLYDAVPVIRNNLFSGNRTSVGMGAAMAFYGWVRHKGGPALAVKENRLTGGLRARVENNVLLRNCAGVNDLYRTRSSSGGGIACAYEARPVILNNLIAGNRARGNSDAGGVYCEYFSDPDILGNWILGNEGDDDGGGIYTMKLGHPLIRGNIIAGNWTTGGGIGGVRLSKEGRARIDDNIIVQNPGGGVMCVDAFMELEHNIIADNPAGNGLTYVNHYSYLQTSIVRENVFRNNEKGAILIREESIIRPEMQKNNIVDQSDPDPFSDEEIARKIHSVSYDPGHFTTEIRLQKPIAAETSLNGRVIKIGAMWTIIKMHKGDRVFVWGDFSDGVGKGTLLTVIRTYDLKK